MKSFTAELIDELEILALYNLDNHQEGLKVHNNASFKAQGAITRLYEKGLVSQADGGYLTSLGIDAAEHAQAVLTILAKRQATPA
ncbi:TIGR02647 family protein [Pseudomonas sp. NCHU5208]|uniref:TIGR02647 family protein n=1 Tax=unclassified Pseudomonas TaxID=196821 RepID=UPI003F96DCCA